MQLSENKQIAAKKTDVGKEQLKNKCNNQYLSINMMDVCKNNLSSYSG